MGRRVAEGGTFEVISDGIIVESRTAVLTVECALVFNSVTVTDVAVGSCNKQRHN